MTAKNFVLVHGAWHGGWCWARVAERLRAAGHRVFTPTMTGLGERAHLLTPAVGLDTWIADAAGVIEAEELSDVVLVGHSFGGNVISGVADRMAGRLAHLVYLDALVIEGGRGPLEAFAPDIQAARRKAAEDYSGGLSLPVPDPMVFGGPFTDADMAWLKRRLTPHPFKTYTDKLMLEHPVGNGVAKTYIVVTDPIYPGLSGVRERLESQPGWAWREIATGHDAMVSAPAALSDLLRDIAGA